MDEEDSILICSSGENHLLASVLCAWSEKGQKQGETESEIEDKNERERALKISGENLFPILIPTIDDRGVKGG